MTSQPKQFNSLRPFKKPTNTVTTSASDSISPLAELKKKTKNDSVTFSKDRMKSGSFSLTGTGTVNRNRASTSLGIKSIKNMGFKTTTALNFYDNWKIGNYPDTCAKILTNLLSGFGINNDDDLHSEVIEKIYSRLSENTANRAPLLQRDQLLQLQQIPEDLHNLFIGQRKLEAVVKIQSRIRGFLVRKRIKTFFKEEGIPLSKTRTYELLSCFKDLLATETDYVKKLDTIVTWYLQPLRRASNKRNSVLSNFLQGISITGADVAAIFSNIETLYSVHLNIQKRFERVAADWPFIDNVGDTFIRLAPDLVCYGDYVRNCKNAIDILARCKEEDPKLNGFLQETTLQGHGDLMGLLVRPLNHISNYKSVLEFFIKMSPTEHPDLENLRNAFVAIKKTCKYIRESNKQAAERAKLGEVARRLVFKSPMELGVPKRFFEEEGEISTMEKTITFNLEKERRYFLFTDLFIIGEETGKNQCKVRNVFDLKCSQVEENAALQNSFFISEVAEKEKSTVICKTPHQKLLLTKKLKDSIENLSTNKRAFGVPLQKVLEMEKPKEGIPYVVRTAIEFLQTKKETEGIFRISGGTTEVVALKQLYNNVQDYSKSIDLGSFSAHTVAAVLKTWFRELPEPIMTFQSYKPLSTLPLDGEEQKLEAVKVIQKVISEIPPTNQKILKFLCSFLISISEQGSINKMTNANLAIVFGPNLLVAQEESLETILRIPKINFVVQLILENYEVIFGNKE